MFSKSFVLLVLASFAAATPLTRQNFPCHPNFEGVGLSIVSGNQEWTVPQPPNPGSFLSTRQENDDNTEYRVEQTGSANPQYVFKALGVSANNIQVEVNNNGVLVLATEDDNDNAQKYTIDCGVCHTGATTFDGAFATGCHIVSVSNGKCVQLERLSENLPNRLDTQDCNGSADQTWSFVTTGQ